MNKLRYTFNNFVIDICKVDSKNKIEPYIEIELRNNKLNLDDIKKFLKTICPLVDEDKLEFSTKGISSL